MLRPCGTCWNQRNCWVVTLDVTLGSCCRRFGSRRIRSRRRGGGTPTRTPPNGPDAPGANVDNMRSLLLTEHLLTQLFSILEDGGRGRNQSDAEYQAEQQNLREQHQVCTTSRHLP